MSNGRANPIKKKKKDMFPNGIRNRFVGSTLAAWSGAFFLVYGMFDLVSGGNTGLGTDLSVFAIVIILGSLAYRSVKRRRLGLAPDSTQRRVFEGIALLAIVILVLFRRDPMQHFHDEAFGSVYVPVWVLVAYATVLLSKPSSKKPLKGQR